MRIRTGLFLGLTIALPLTCLADFRYDETTKVTGGSLVSMAKMASAFSKQSHSLTDPVNSTVAVKGNRMAHINQDSSEIIDLDSETITHIDHAKKQYSVVTFQEMKAAMQAAMQKAQQQPAQPTSNAGTPPPQVNFKVNVTNTGATKQVAGLSSTESILKMTMDATNQQSGQTGSLAITNDMWMAPEIPGYGEVRDFNQRMAAKMGDVFGGTSPSMSPSMFSSQPGMSAGMGDMVKEMSKLKGVPVSQVMRMGSTTDGSALPAASEAPLPQSNGPSGSSVTNQAASGAANSAADSATNTATNAATSHMGTFGSALSSLGGFHKKSSQPPPQPPPPAQPTTAQNWTVLMESTTEMTNFSSASVDPSLFDVPAGYTKVPSQYQKGQ
jgi:hypothetical protein